ncbi:MAG: hypothetical protein II336_00250 [Loktanella sp.]|nr:hypothetical protein [Loktanella sp.]
MRDVVSAQMARPETGYFKAADHRQCRGFATADGTSGASNSRSPKVKLACSTAAASLL